MSDHNPLPEARRDAVHIPVLLREVLREMQLEPGLRVVDGTVGAGGHSRELWSRIQPGGRLLGLDRDRRMLEHARAAVAGTATELVHAPYSQLRQVLNDRGLAAVDRILLDLGLSSDQLADRSRGFGFEGGGPLDMRFDDSTGAPVSDWLNRAPAADISRVLTDYGEVEQAGRLADRIVTHRRAKPLETVADLLSCLPGEHPRSGRGKSIIPQVFQALRIQANSELDHLQMFLSTVLPATLQPGGLVAIISFHSLEDRLVKQALTPLQGWEPVHRKPIEATPAEIRLNPRSRSARLRVARRSVSGSAAAP